MYRTPEDFVRKSIRHELTSQLTVLEGREELEEDGADISLRYLSDFLQNTGSETRGPITEYRDRYPLEENLRTSADYIRQRLENDEFRAENNSERAREIVQTLDGAADLLSTLTGDEPGTVRMGEVLEPFQDDLAGIEYNGHQDDVVTGNRGYWIPFHTLISNAERHGGPDVDVYADVTADDSSVDVSLWDDGPGIDVMPVTYENLDDLWEEDTSSDGGGFGLYMAKTVFTAYGGGIEFDRELMQDDGVGCAYTIELPRPAYDL